MNVAARPFQPIFEIASATRNSFPKSARAETSSLPVPLSRIARKTPIYLSAGRWPETLPGGEEDRLGHRNHSPTTRRWVNDGGFNLASSPPEMPVGAWRRDNVSPRRQHCGAWTLALAWKGKSKWRKRVGFGAIHRPLSNQRTITDARRFCDRGRSPRS